jgi:hypothetical protein
MSSEADIDEYFSGSLKWVDRGHSRFNGPFKHFERPEPAIKSHSPSANERPV